MVKETKPQGPTQADLQLSIRYFRSCKAIYENSKLPDVPITAHSWTLYLGKLWIKIQSIAFLPLNLLTFYESRSIRFWHRKLIDFPTQWCLNKKYTRTHRRLPENFESGYDINEMGAEYTQIESKGKSCFWRNDWCLHSNCNNVAVKNLQRRTIRHNTIRD